MRPIATSPSVSPPSLASPTATLSTTIIWIAWPCRAEQIIRRLRPAACRLLDLDANLNAAIASLGHGCLYPCVMMAPENHQITDNAGFRRFFGVGLGKTREGLMIAPRVDNSITSTKQRARLSSSDIIQSFCKRRRPKTAGVGDLVVQLAPNLRWPRRHVTRSSSS